DPAQSCAPTIRPALPSILPPARPIVDFVESGFRSTRAISFPYACAGLCREQKGLLQLLMNCPLRDLSMLQQLRCLSPVLPLRVCPSMLSSGTAKLFARWVLED